MSANRFFRGAQGHNVCLFAVTDEVGKSDGQLQSPLSPRACLALTLAAMFSEGTCHSAVAQTDRQMVPVDAEHERDWRSIAPESHRWSPAVEGREGLPRPRCFGGSTSNRAAARGHRGADGRPRSKAPSIKGVARYEKGNSSQYGLRSDLFSPCLHESRPLPAGCLFRLCESCLEPRGFSGNRCN